VEFVQDYLQLRFGDPLLALFAWPHIADADFVSIAHGEPGYRDALCSVIGEDVSATTFNEGSELTIEFEMELSLHCLYARKTSLRQRQATSGHRRTRTSSTNSEE